MSTLRDAYSDWVNKQAGLKRFVVHSGTQAEFDDILMQLSALREQKVAERGEERYNEKDKHRSKILLGADIHRKYQRVDRYLIEGKGGTDNLEDDFKDLANYAIMGIQLMRREGWAYDKNGPELAQGDFDPTARDIVGEQPAVRLPQASEPEPTTGPHPPSDRCPSCGASYWFRKDPWH